MSATDTSTGYYRPAGTYNARLTEVGRGTPMGELMRRYWLPVGLSAYATALPRQVRALGEDLVLFRDRKGRVGLVHPRCCHRGASLFFGSVEEDGIRCCYHGWLFDAQGRCLDQPAEPEGGRHKDKVRQPWYPVEERYGLIWAYMGPTEKKPLLPRYDVFEELEPGDQVYGDDNNVGAVTHLETVPFNWLQHYENIHDMAHVFWLHYLHSGPQFGDRFGEWDLDAMRRQLPEIVASGTLEYSDRGLVYSGKPQRLPDGRRLRTVIETVFPTLRVVPSPFGKLGRVDHVGFVLPVDDTSFKIFTVVRGEGEGRAFSERAAARNASFAPLTVEERQRFPNDFEAQASGGAITLHSEEHLATSDIGVVMVRRQFEAQIKAVEDGKDPIGIHFTPGSEFVRLAAGSFIEEAEAAE